jgi:DNA-binding transcriptional LysR family regulator
MSHFLRENPEVKVELEVSDRLSSISTEGFDLAIGNFQGSCRLDAWNSGCF